ncbi:MAG: hypothetical protein JO212_03735 [Acetobacteraceae bacterium]|nr:hypothetical protein [Acetobacteraceae bacterium]
MTILGVLVKPDRAICWTDSETFEGGEPAGHCPKLVVNPLARVILLGTGFSTLLRPAEEAALQGTSFDDIVAAVCSALRKRAGQLARQLTRLDRNWLACQMAAVVGFSEEAGRMLAYTFSGASFFEPVVTVRIMRPEPEGGPVAEPQCMPELIALARRQIAYVRESCPTATGGVLQVAELRPTEIICRTIPDFDVGDVHMIGVEAGHDQPLRKSVPV